MNNKTVNHNGTEYTIAIMADHYHWKLTEVDSPRQSIVLNADQMKLAGLLSDAPVIDINKVREAQGKAVIAQHIGDEAMWQQANEKFKSAVGRPLH